MKKTANHVAMKKTGKWRGYPAPMTVRVTGMQTSFANRLEPWVKIAPRGKTSTRQQTIHLLPPNPSGHLATKCWQSRPQLKIHRFLFLFVSGLFLSFLFLFEQSYHFLVGCWKTHGKHLPPTGLRGGLWVASPRRWSGCEEVTLRSWVVSLVSDENLWVGKNYHLAKSKSYHQQLFQLSNVNSLLKCSVGLNPVSDFLSWTQLSQRRGHRA